MRIEVDGGWHGAWWWRKRCWQGSDGRRGAGGGCRGGGGGSGRGLGWQCGRATGRLLVVLTDADILEDGGLVDLAPVVVGWDCSCNRGCRPDGRVISHVRVGQAEFVIVSVSVDVSRWLTCVQDRYTAMIRGPSSNGFSLRSTDGAASIFTRAAALEANNRLAALG